MTDEELLAAFQADLQALCEKYGVALCHEDEHGAAYLRRVSGEHAGVDIYLGSVRPERVEGRRPAYPTEVERASRETWERRRIWCGPDHGQGKSNLAPRSAPKPEPIRDFGRCPECGRRGPPGQVCDNPECKRLTVFDE